MSKTLFLFALFAAMAQIYDTNQWNVCLNGFEENLNKYAVALKDMPREGVSGSAGIDTSVISEPMSSLIKALVSVLGTLISTLKGMGINVAMPNISLPDLNSILPANKADDVLVKMMVELFETFSVFWVATSKVKSTLDVYLAAKGAAVV